MSRDTKSKVYKKSQSKKEELKRVNNESSDSDDHDYSNSDEDEELDVQKYHKFLAKTFPSKHMDKKVEAMKRLKKGLKNDIDNKNSKKSPKKQLILSDDSEDDDDDEEYIPKRSSKKLSKRSSKKVETEDEEDDEEYIPKKSSKRSSKKIVSDTEDDEEEEEEEDDNDEEVNGKTSKFNITFTIGGGKHDEEEDEWMTCSDDEDEEDYETENEDDPVSSDEETNEEDEEEEEEKVNRKSKKQNKQVITKEPNKTEQEPSSNVLDILKDIQSKNKDDELVAECIQICENKIKATKQKNEKKFKKQKDRNSRIFKRILRDKNTMNDFEFFEKLEIENQKKIIKELREINKITRVEKPYRLTLLESDMPLIFKSAALKKISSLRYMEPGSGEFYKIKNWVDTFMRIPFGKYTNLPISIDDGVDKCHDFMANAQKTLDDAVYGLNDAKMQVMQMLGQLVTNPKSIGTAIALLGPPGTGKTTIVKEGISKILNRPFAFIALGGATDSSFLEGHGYTYEGSTWGKIVQFLIDSKCMNPVIYFDELDKISDTPKGEEITGILTHLTDTSQNSQFHDKYFTEIDFDLSKCLFIFSYNDESKVNPILKDRMYRIQTKGYNQKQKTVIANSHLLPKIRDQVRFKVEDIVIPDDTLHYIIEQFCNKEDGVRNLKRCLEIIYTKLNLYRLMRPGSNLFEEDMSLKVEFPFKVTKDIVDKLVKNSKENSSALYSMYM
jgi:ATP-dependent Lon protease